MIRSDVLTPEPFTNAIPDEVPANLFAHLAAMLFVPQPKDTSHVAGPAPADCTTSGLHPSTK